MFRTEKDNLGEKKIPIKALYGIHALRASENFPPNLQFPVEWYRAVGITKLACYNTYRNFRDAASEKYKDNLHIRVLSNEILDALVAAASEVSQGDHFEQFIVPAVQGGAGTSINMNINEIIANAALLKTGHNCGNYDFIDPVEHANICQSTNDVVPTALTVAVMKLLQGLEDEVNSLRQKVESLEKKHREDLRPGYTQMQEAVPSSFGIMFSTYNDALSRDWWRISKVSERIKQVNLGGGAIGTGLSQLTYFIMNVVTSLRSLTGLPLARAENMADATANLDKWVELHATLKSHAVNLEKMTSDLRLLASDVAGAKLISLPERQVGSSIMPGKINPVIPEFVISASHKVYSNDILVSSLASQGTLDLNAYIPVIGFSVIESVKLLTSCCKTLNSNLISGLRINTSAGYDALLLSPSVTTALVPHVGYHKAAELAAIMKEKKISIYKANNFLQIIDEDRLGKILSPGNLLKLGFSLEDF